MLTAYADESGHSKHPDCNYMALAGFVGSDSEWQSFEHDWKAATSEYICGAEVHMRNFGRGQMYAGWSKEKLSAFMTRLVAAIVESGVHPVACAVYLPDFEELSPAHKAGVVDPYYMAFQEITKGLALRGSPIMSPDLLLKPNPVYPDDFKTDPVAMVYAFQQEYGATPAGRAQQLWHIIKNSDKFQWAAWMGTYASAKPKNVLPLQAADLFAYELTRELEAWTKAPTPPMRDGLKGLLRGFKWQALIKVYTLPVILDMLWNSGAFGDTKGVVNGPYSLVANEHMFKVRQILKERSSVGN
jgi:hypothetical protein